MIPPTPPLVLREHRGLVFVCKPPGVLSIPGRDPTQMDVITARVAQALSLSEPPRICHRLDRDTSGVMVLALTVEAQRAASAEFEKHRVRKGYLALVQGAFEGTRTVDASLCEDPEAPRGQRARQRVSNDGAASRTLLRGLWTDGTCSLVAARPSTGRTHQVRAHLAHAGFPLLGDVMYGGPAGERPLLHAAFLWLRALGEDLSAGAPLWPDMAAFLTARGVAVPLPADVDAALTQGARAALRA